MFDANRLAILKGNLVRLGVATGRSGLETVVVKWCPFMWSERERSVFCNVKSIAFITLELVDKVHRLALCMSNYGVSEVGTKAGEQVDGMVNRAGLTSGSISEGASKGGRFMVRRLVSTISWWRLGVC